MRKLQGNNLLPSDLICVPLVAPSCRDVSFLSTIIFVAIHMYFSGGMLMRVHIFFSAAGCPHDKDCPAVDSSRWFQSGKFLHVLDTSFNITYFQIFGWKTHWSIYEVELSEEILQSKRQSGSPRIIGFITSLNLVRKSYRVKDKVGAPEL